MNRRDFCRNLLWTSGGLLVASGCSSNFRRHRAIASNKTADARSRNGEPFLYILRFAMVPDFHEAARLEALLAFCREAQVDDVAFILWAEGLCTGHPTPEEVEPWLLTIERVKPRLAALGITTSLNPWVTLLHGDRGRSLKPGQDFRLMVDPDGRVARAVACPLCPAWREHLCRHFERLARIRPRIIWVEDDFRLHNHAPLQWGGCFCELHMEEYSRRADRMLLREEFVKGVLQPGSPHPFRRIWLDTSRDTMVDVAQMLGQAVRRVSPETQVGLMSSSPATHCIEGRDWEGVLRGLAAGKAPVNRPHLPGYIETTGAQYLWGFSQISRRTAAMVPAETRLYPELENYPHSRFSKSRMFTRFQIESSAALGADGIAMNIYDVLGNGVMPHEDYAPVLAQAKPLARKIRELQLNPRNEIGAQVLFNPHASYSLWTERGQSFGELAPDEDFWAGLLGVMGIAHTFREWVGQKQAVLAVSGQYFRGLKTPQISDLLSNNIVLLNGSAIFTLQQMGLGAAVGVRRADWLSSSSGMASYEQVTDGRSYVGLHEARLTAHALTGDYLKIEYEGDVSLHTEVRDASGATTGPGMAVVGRRVVVLPYGRSGGGYHGLRNPVRQALLQRLLLDLTGQACPAFVKGSAYVALYDHALGAQRALLLVNFSNDDYPQLHLHCVGVTGRNAIAITSEGVRVLRRDLRQEGDDLVLRSGLRGLEVKALLLNPQ